MDKNANNSLNEHLWRFKHHIRNPCLILNIFQKKSKEFR
jgi:hypothetical protein